MNMTSATYSVQSVLTSYGVPYITVASDIPETINVDGKERHTKNSKCALIHPTIEGIKNFWSWFGDSKVVNKNGNPLVVYHGTDEDDLDEITAGWFTRDIRNCSEYGSHVYTCYLHIEKPANESDLIRIYEEHTGEDYDLDAKYEADDYYTLMDMCDDDYEFRRKVIAAGFTGIITQDESLPIVGPAYVPFYPEDIKSVTENTGDFDTQSSRITASADVQLDQKARATL